MKLLYVADGRSPIAMNWIGHFIRSGVEVHLASTFPCPPEAKLSSLHILDVAFSRVKTGDGRAPGGQRRGIWGGWAVGLRTALRQRLGPLTLPPAARRLREICDRVQPDLVHAMRIPYEGMLAALAGLPAPLLISVWGNDFTLHAPAAPGMARLTRQALERADALHADCYRDIDLAHAWGFPVGRPGIVLPGAGGVQSELFYPGEAAREAVVINPRGFRAYVRNDAFFQAVPRVLEICPQARFICPQMAGEPRAQAWLDQLGVRGAVELLPGVPRARMAELFRIAQVAVSPSFHDGTPNTLLEAMACGCFPIAGDIASLREWIVPGVNGLLVDPGSPRELAEATVLALENPELCRRAARINRELVAGRAEHRRVMAQAEKFYQALINV